jgi:anaerobic selenocysteine-containing dehydrogenase
VVVSLLPFDGPLAREADVLVPAPAPLEAWDEVLPTPDAAVASYALAAPVLKPPAGATDTVAFVQALGAALGLAVDGRTHEERLRERAAAIGADWDDLAAGGGWAGEPERPAPLAVSVPPPSPDTLAAWTRPRRDEDGLSLVAFAARGTAGTTPVSPLLTKLYQETDLRRPTTVAAVSPAAAARLGLVDAQPVRLESPAGSVRAELRLDPTLPGDRVALAAGPEPAALHAGAPAGTRGALPLAAAEADGTWRGTRVRVREARA